MIDSKQRAYFYAIGQFIHSYAKAEMFVHFSFAVFSQIDHKLAMAIKGSMRLIDLMPTIRRIVALRGFSEAERAEVDSLFTQLNIISEFRDRVIHRGADPSPGDTFFSSNIATMKAVELAETVTFTLKDVRNATYDLRRIALRVIRACHRIDSRAFFGKRHRQIFGPWRYKPPKLDNPHPQHPANAARQKRQHRASQA